MLNKIILELLSRQNPKNVEGMSRFKIGGEGVLLVGVGTTELRKYAREIKTQLAETIKKDIKDKESFSSKQIKEKNNEVIHQLALSLWDYEHEGQHLHEARLLASIIDDPKKVKEDQMEHWIKGFKSWDLCDQSILNSFYVFPTSHEKAIEWSKRESIFEKRAGFSMMAVLSYKNKIMTDDEYLPFLKRIEEEAHDERNFVKKSVNWALRQIGKRNINLHGKAVELSEKLIVMDSKSARWIGKDALKELSDPKKIEQIQKK